MAQIRVRRGTTAQWEASEYVLASGEPGYDTELSVFKVGNGVSLWSDLPALGGDGGFSTEAVWAMVDGEEEVSPVVTIPSGRIVQVIIESYAPAVEDESPLTVTLDTSNIQVGDILLVWVNQVTEGRAIALQFGSDPGSYTFTTRPNQSVSSQTTTFLSARYSTIVDEEEVILPQWSVGRIVASGADPVTISDTAPDSATSLLWLNPDTGALMRWSDLLGEWQPVGEPSPMVAYHALALGRAVPGDVSSISLGETDAVNTAGSYAIAVGSGASAPGTNDIVVGVNATSADSSHQIVLGFGAESQTSNTIVIGFQAKVEETGPGAGPNALVIGYQASATDATNAAVVGFGASAKGSGSTVFGQGAKTDPADFGSGTSVSNSVVIGTQAESTGVNAVVVGDNADVGASSGGVAIGNSAQVTVDGTLGVALGQSALSAEVGAVAIGNAAQATHEGSIAIGHGAQTTADAQAMILADELVVLSDVLTPEATTLVLHEADGTAVRIGVADAALTVDGVPVGTGDDTGNVLGGEVNTAMGGSGVAVGDSLITNGSSDAVAVGPDATVTDGSGGGVAVGKSATVTSGGSVAVGRNALAGTSSVAIGEGAGENSPSVPEYVAVGRNAKADVYSVAVGHGAVTSAGNGIAVGRNAQTTQSNSLAIGSGAVAQNWGSIAIGDSALADADGLAVFAADSLRVDTASFEKDYASTLQLRQPDGTISVIGVTAAGITVDGVLVGAGGGGGGLPQIATETITAAEDADYLLDLGAVGQILDVTVSGACRVRAYRTSAERTADASRPFATPYTAENGLLYDYLFTGAKTDLGRVWGYAGDVYVRVDGGPADVDVRYVTTGVL